MRILRNIVACIIIICAFSWYFTISAGLPFGTKIATSDGLVEIESLSVGSLITGYNQYDATCIEVVIKNIVHYEQYGVFAIRAAKGTIYASGEQLFYDYAVNQFVQAKDLTNESVLIAQDGQLCQCLAIEFLNKPIVFYHIILDEPHLFFSSDVCVLTHNMASAALNLAPLTRWVLGSAIAYIHRNWIPQIFADRVFGEKFITMRVLEYAKERVVSLPLQSDRIFGLYPPVIAGIRIDSNVYKDMKSAPILYGPMCITAEIHSSGNIACELYVMHFDGLFNIQDAMQNLYFWQNAGCAIISEDNCLIENFIKNENKAKLNELSEFVKTWPLGLKNYCDVGYKSRSAKQFPCNCIDYEKTIYGMQCGVDAIFNMVKKDIPPFRVLKALHCGNSIPARYPGLMICCDKQNDIVIIFEAESKKVLNVGHYSKDMHVLNQLDYQEVSEVTAAQKPKETNDNGKKPNKTVEDILQDVTPGRATLGKSKQFEKGGSYADALKDFESMGATEVQDIEKGKRGKLPDGSDVNVRITSSDGRPILEIQNKNNGKRIKIRYGK